MEVWGLKKEGAGKGERRSKRKKAAVEKKKSRRGNSILSLGISSRQSGAECFSEQRDKSSIPVATPHHACAGRRRAAAEGPRGAKTTTKKSKNELVDRNWSLLRRGSAAALVLLLSQR